MLGLYVHNTELSHVETVMYPSHTVPEQIYQGCLSVPNAHCLASNGQELKLLIHWKKKLDLLEEENGNQRIFLAHLSRSAHKVSL